MKKLAFLDHAFHKKTRSSDFFIRLLQTDYSVDLIYLSDDPREQLRDIVTVGYDLIVCWQTEYVSPYLLLQGQRVVCIPMYDGVANAPDWYWRPMGQARFVNFCSALNHKHSSLALDAMYVQYFGEDKEEGFPRKDFSDLRGFFWQRRPEDGLDYQFASTVLARLTQHIHVHNAPDSGVNTEVDRSVVTGVSTFEAEPTAYKKALAVSNVYLCPRKTEGIGMAMIEALSQGFLVIAHNAPTANEYIRSGINGLLINYDNPHALSVSLDDAARMGKHAMTSIQIGRRQWTGKTAELVFFLSTVPKPSFGRHQSGFAERYLEIIPLFADDHAMFMRKMLALVRSGLSGTDFSSVPLLEQTLWSLRTVPGVRLVGRLLRKATRRAHSFFARH